MVLEKLSNVSYRWLSHVGQTWFQADVEWCLTLIFKDFFPVYVFVIRKLWNCVLCDPQGIIWFAVHILHMIFINVKIYDYIMV